MRHVARLPHLRRHRQDGHHLVRSSDAGEAMRRAQDESLRCDLFLCVGSSLVVYPAAGLPVIAKKSGARLVILNRDSTDLDAIADQVLNREIGETLARVVAGAES